MSTGARLQPGNAEAGEKDVQKQAAQLRYAVRCAVVLKYVGQLCVVLAALTAVPLGVAWLLGDTRLALRLGTVLAALAGGGLALARLRAPSNLQQNEGLTIVALIFLVAALAMSYPFMSVGLSFPDAVFEAVSGVTTTGLTTVLQPSHVSWPFLFTRAWMQWYGGLGIVVLSLALVVPPGLAAKGLAVGESADGDLVGGTKANARRLLLVYSLLTGGGVVLLSLLGVPTLDALLYALAAVSTGGFGVHNAGLAGLHAWLPQAAVLFLCLLCALPLAAYHTLGRRQRLDRETLLQATALGSAVIVTWIGLVVCAQVSGPREWHAVLQDLSLIAVSAQTTAGFSPIDAAHLDHASKLVLILAMITGASVGSTAGGVKLLRVLLAFSLLRLTILRASVTPHTAVAPRLWGRRLHPEEPQRALLLILLFLGVVLVSWLPFLLAGYEPLDALFEVVSATGTVGLSVGITRHALPVFLKGVLCADMLLGRLEIVAWLILLAPGTWFGQRMRTP